MRAIPATTEMVYEHKEGILSNVLTILFMVGLTVSTIWFVRRLGHGNEPAVWLVCIMWMLSLYFPISNLRNPKSCSLVIEGDVLVSISRGFRGRRKCGWIRKTHGGLSAI